jgi:hypothetical protein
LHWLLSESVFLVYPSTYNCIGELYTGNATLQPYMGFSFIAIITSIVTGVLFLVLLIPLWCLWPIKGPMPLAGSNSRAIASACYRPDDDIDAHVMPVTYGAVVTVNGEPPHCSFTTARDVMPPEERVYK